MHSRIHSSLLTSLALLAGLPVPSAALAQGAGDEPASGVPSAPAAVPVQAVDGLPGEPEPEDLRDAIVQGPWRELPAIERGDDVPPAGSDLFVPGPDGDVLVRKADGNPWFLGFAAGSYYPPAGERVDPELRAVAARPRVDARDADEIYGFVMFGKRITAARIAELNALGVRDLGRHPHHSLKVALPADALDLVANLPFVHWVGAPRHWQKLHPELTTRLEGAPAEALHDVWISVFENDRDAEIAPVSARFESFDPSGGVVAPAPAAADPRQSGGWQELALRELGLETFEYVEASRSFRARVRASDVELLTELDFVQFLSPDVEVHALHDESMPMVGADLSRASWDGGLNEEVIVGVVDSGITITHDGFAPIWAAGWDFTGEGAGAWNDLRVHGSHVAGTILGRGSLEDSYAGAAPGVASWGGAGRLFNYKIIDSNNNTTGVNWDTLYSYVRSGWTDQNNLTTPKPHLLNHSWGSAAGNWFGTEPQSVAWDTEVYDENQMHIFAAGNSGPGASTLTQQSSAKNVLSVGGMVDFNSQTSGLPGSLWASSSRGPVADGRWKPNIVAPANRILSIAALTDSDYMNAFGTSMAAPHVTGVAAQLLDHYSFLRYKPAATAALLMATALSPNDNALTTPADPQLSQFGAGRVDASRANGSTSQQDLYFWGWPSASGNSTLDVDVDLLPGATRMTVVMVYHETAASVGANQSLVNDWDMWIDAAPFTAGGNTGEFGAQQSSINNVEIRTLNNPSASSYRIKLFPDDVTSTCRVGLAVSVIYGDTTPNGSLTLTGSDAYVTPNEVVQFTAQAFNPSYWASSVFLNSTVSSGSDLITSTGTLKDGATADFTGNMHNGYDVLLGSIRHGQSRSASWTASWNTEGVKTWSVNAVSDNWVDKSAQVQVTVDGTAPGLVTNLVSTSHQPGVWSNDPVIDYAWTAASDNLSGVDGYGVFTSNSPNGAPSAEKDFGAVTTFSEALSTDALPYYFKIRTLDRSGNWSPGYATAGGYLIDTLAPTAAGNLASTTHQVGETSCSGSIEMTWTAALEQHSGIDRYIAQWNQLPNTNPLFGTQLPANATGLQAQLDEGTWYLHLRAVDVAGNFGATAHAGPFTIDPSPWTTYCTAKVTSSGCTPEIAAGGSSSIGNPGGFTVTGQQLQQQQNGIGFFGLNGPANVPFQGGSLCVGAPVYRLPMANTGGAGACSGTLSYTLADLLANPAGGALIGAGSTVNLQFWFRDPLASFGSGLSNGIQFLVCP